MTDRVSVLHLSSYLILSATQKSLPSPIFILQMSPQRRAKVKYFSPGYNSRSVGTKNLKAVLVEYKIHGFLTE